jgi:hypothetical protein
MEMERYDKFERIKALIQLGYAVSVDFRLHGDKKRLRLVCPEIATLKSCYLVAKKFSESLNY